ncbi:MAG: hypothetical protein HY897_00430 [Deltaproteobacteria bacterium]|nr:hypothetical protein [Deltaproteobacteria bacterium]
MAASCGVDEPSGIGNGGSDSAEATSDAARDAGTADTGADAETTSDGSQDAETDAGADGGTKDVGADGGTTDIGADVICAAGEACNALLDDGGLCPGECIAQRHGLWCRGTVFNGLCHRLPPDTRTNPDATFGDLELRPGWVPARVLPGDEIDVLLSATNTSTKSQSFTFSHKHPDTWELVSSSFDGLNSLDLDAGQKIELRARMRAVKPDVFSGGVIITFFIGENAYDMKTTIVFPPDGNVACGGFHFPASWCANPADCFSGPFYNNSICCDAVFYPGAFCCADAGCQGGPCIDGKCVDAVPQMNQANTVMRGNHRMLVVASDITPHDTSDVCQNRYAELRGQFGLEGFEEYVRSVLSARTRKAEIGFDWYVIAGIEAEDFIKNGQYDFLNFSSQLEDFVAGRGCIGGFDEFDKVIMASPKVDIGGMGGVANALGRIAAVTLYDNLIAHEVAHTWGATDLYIEMGSQFQYQLDLMGNNLGGFGPPEDGVMRGEMGLADIDGNGVIDVFEFAVYPEALEIAKLEAYLTYKDTLEIHAAVGAIENGRHMKVIIPSFSADLPDYGVTKEFFYTNTVVLDATEIDLAAVRAAGSLNVHLTAKHKFTDRDFFRQALNLDEARTIPVSEMQR